jgi:hypothetical protein
MTGDHTACWNRLVDAANGGEWDRMRSCMASDVVQHQSTAGVGATVVRFSGVDEVLEAHRRIAQTGVRWEVVTLAEVDDLVTGSVRVGLPNAKRSLSAIVLSFDTAGLVADIYSHIAAPDTGPAEVDTMDGSTAPA